MKPERLDDGKLYVFVFGKGFGESIAIRIPPDYWVVIDSCRIGGMAAARHALQQYGGERCALVLTHAHKDHYRGFSELLGDGDWMYIGATKVSLDISYQRSQSASRHLNAELTQALSTIRRRWKMAPGCAWHTLRKCSRTIGDARLVALHPTAETGPESPPNNLSSAMLLEWEQVRILLGADVENPHWTTIGRECIDERIADHVALKAPHHASHESASSRGSMNESYLIGRRDRACVVTPYNKGQKLPSAADNGGIHALLQWMDTVYLTGLPVRHSNQADEPCETTRQELRDGAKPRPLVRSVLGSRDGVVRPVYDDQLNCYLVLKLCADGVCEEVLCGPGTVQVTEADS